MSCQSFPRFLDFPKELQVQILEHAIEETQGIIVLFTELRVYPVDWFGQYRRPFFWTDLISTTGRDKRVRAIYVREHNWHSMRPFLVVMQSCKLAREIGLMMWRRKLKQTPFLGNGSFDDDLRTKLLDVVGELIEQLRHQ